MTRKMTVADTIATKVESLKLRRKPTDILLSAEVVLRAMKEADGDILHNDKGEFGLTFANEDADTLEFSLVTSGDGGLMGAISKFSNKYVRMTGVPPEYRDEVIIESIPSINPKRTRTAETAEKTNDEKSEKQPPKSENVFDSVSTEEIEALLAARKSKSEDSKHAKEYTTDDNETDSGGEPEAEEQSGLNNDEAAPDDDSKYDETDEEETEEKSYEDELFEHKGGKFPK